MPKYPWRDDDLRQEAERLMSSYAHLWPSRCEQSKCTRPFPRSFTKDQTTSSNFTLRRFRCTGCKTNIGVKQALTVLRAIEQDTSAASLIVSAVLKQSAPSPSAPSQQRIPMNQSLHMSDLGSVREDADMSDVNDDDYQVAPHPSPLVQYAESRPEDYLTPYLPQHFQRTLSPPITQNFTSPLPSQYAPWSAGSQQPAHPSQLPHVQNGSQPQPMSQYSPSLHPSQWSHMSGATPAQTLTQVAPTLSPPSPGPPVSEFRASPQAESSVAAGKRRHMEASIWQQKQARFDASYHMPPEHLSPIQQALDMSERTSQQLMATNQTLQEQLTRLVHEVAQLRKELQDSRQELALAKAAPAPPAVPTSPTPPAPVAQQARKNPVQKNPVQQAQSTESATTTVITCPEIDMESVLPTYAGAVRKTLTDAQLAIIQSMKPPPRPFKARQPASAAPKPDSVPVCVYFAGVQSGPLKVFKERLRTLRVRTSQIYNISFIGKSICEFLVDTSYKAKFIETMSGFTFRHLPNFDPAVPQDPNVTPETRDLLKQAYTRRLTAMASTTNRGFVREVFLGMMTAAGAVVPADLPDLTTVVPTAPSAPSPATVAEPAAEITIVETDPAAEVPAGASDKGMTDAPIVCDPTTSSIPHE